MEGKLSQEISGRSNKHEQTKVKHKHKHKSDRDRRDKAKPSLSKPDKPEKKFIEVNSSYQTICEEVG